MLDAKPTTPVMAKLFEPLMSFDTAHADWSTILLVPPGTDHSTSCSNLQAFRNQNSLKCSVDANEEATEARARSKSQMIDPSSAAA